MNFQLRLGVNFNFRMTVLAGILLAGVAGLLPALPADAADRLVIYSGRKEKAIKPVVDVFTKQTGVLVELKVGKTSGLGRRRRRAQGGAVPSRFRQGPARERAQDPDGQH